jgi:hypothetical protein
MLIFYTIKFLICAPITEFAMHLWENRVDYFSAPTNAG